MKVLINAIGIANSGGAVVLKKLMLELLDAPKDHTFIFLVTKNSHVDALIDRYKQVSQFSFISFEFNNAFSRLLYENIRLRKFLIDNDISLVYNFSGSLQFFGTTPQLVKVHNLLFYCKKLDNFYKTNFSLALWLKQIFFKRLVFRFMLANSANLEVQSNHVATALSDFIDIAKKNLFIKSDIDICSQSFSFPVRYDFGKKIKFLYIVGPHFEYPHKNIIDFTLAMVELKKSNVDFEINITLTRDQLNQSDGWDNSLNQNTNFHGYIHDAKDMDKLFCDNTILVSTSIIETLGLHVIEAIKHGIVTITPNEDYAAEVYGTLRFVYDLFDPSSLSSAVRNIVSNEGTLSNVILAQQQYLKENEMTKFNNIIDVFDDVLSRKS
ncbi:glycosyltransferase [Amylibacter sp.]|nr:glycosyltransferase [Amylibacter sp.]